MKKIILSAFALSVSVLAIGLTNTRVRADANARYCSSNNSNTGQDLACNYYTFAQCTAGISGQGGTCISNPRLNSANASIRNQR